MVSFVSLFIIFDRNDAHCFHLSSSVYQPWRVNRHVWPVSVESSSRTIQVHSFVRTWLIIICRVRVRKSLIQVFHLLLLLLLAHLNGLCILVARAPASSSGQMTLRTLKIVTIQMGVVVLGRPSFTCIFVFCNVTIVASLLLSPIVLNCIR